MGIRERGKRKIKGREGRRMNEGKEKRGERGKGRGRGREEKREQGRNFTSEARCTEIKLV